MATAATFRRLALALPQATEGAHGGHPDFRDANKVFASLGVPDNTWGMVKLTPQQQDMLSDAEPGAFKPATGAWAAAATRTSASRPSIRRPWEPRWPWLGAIRHPRSCWRPSGSDPPAERH